MNILQTAEPVIRRCNAKGVTHPAVPGRRKIGNRQITGQQRRFQLITQDDMQRIGDLIRIHPDKARHHLLIEAQDIVHLPRRPRSVKCRPDPRQGIDHEVRTAGQLHLNQQRLAFMQRHTARLPDRLGPPVFRQSLLVKGMAGFMQGPHQALGEIIRFIAGGQPHVIRNTPRKRMMADIKASVIEIESQGRHEFKTEASLPGFIKRAIGPKTHAIAFLPVQHRRQKIREKSFQIGKQRVNHGLTATGFILIQQGIIGRQAKGR